MSKPRFFFRSWRGGVATVAAVAAVAAVLPALAIERGPARAFSSAAVSPAETQARVIVKYKADSTLMRALSATSSGTSGGTVMPLHAQAMGKRLGVALVDGRANGPSSQVVTATGITSADLAARLSAQSDVEYAVADQRVHALTIPSDPLFAAGQATTPATGQWYLRTPGGDGEVASINAEAAWGITTGSSSVVVAVVDTGITTHPDLTGKVLAGYNFISDAAAAGNGVGRSADATDYGDGVTAADASTISGCTSSDIGNSSWHGTQTSGLIGASTNNGVGIASVGWNVMILPVRALGKCGGSSSDVSASIRWAAGITVPGVPVNPNPAKVINLSLGGTSGVACSSDYQDAVTSAIARGVVVVAAAGNDGLALGSPANCTGVIAVAGVRHAGTKVGYSDLGTGVTIAAPAGNCVNSTGTCLYPLITTSNDGASSVGNPVYTDGDIRPSLGTSFSAPLVSGTVALMFSANPSMTPSAITTGLQSTSRPFTASGSAPLVTASASTVTGGTGVNLTGASVAACVAPGTTAQSVECYCTTATCGSGLLDAGAAVSVASGLPAGSRSSAGQSATIVSYQWAIASTTGSATAVFTGSTTQANASVVTGGAGSFTASLTTTDSLNQVRTATTTVAVTAAAATPAPTVTVTGSSSSVTAGGSVTFTGTALSGTAATVVQTYLWTLTNGSSIATFSGATNGQSATVVTTAAGTFTVNLTVTDINGKTGTGTSTVTVAAATGTTTAPVTGSTTSSSSSGGGSVSPGWLLGLLMAVVALFVVGPVRRRS